MPIVRLRLPEEQRGFEAPFAQSLQPINLIPPFLRAGALFTTYDPNTLTDITPAYWDTPHHRYILQMKKIPEAGILHILSKDNLPHVGIAGSTSSEVYSILQGPEVTHIHIPAHRDIVPIGQTLPNKNIEIGAIVMRIPLDMLEDMQKGFGVQESEI